MKTHRKTSVLLFVDNSRYINDSHYEFGKMFVARITLSHPCLVKIHKMLLSNWRVTLFRGRFSSRFGLWTLAIKQIALRAHATLSEYMQFVHVLENITSCSLFSNCLRPFNFSHHTVTSNKHPFPILIEDMQCRAKSLWLSVLVMIFASFSDGFKCFHTIDMFAALVHDCVTSLFGTI